MGVQSESLPIMITAVQPLPSGNKLGALRASSRSLTATANACSVFWYRNTGGCLNCTNRLTNSSSLGNNAIVLSTTWYPKNECVTLCTLCSCFGYLVLMPLARLDSTRVEGSEVKWIDTALYSSSQKSPRMRLTLSIVGWMRQKAVTPYSCYRFQVMFMQRVMLCSRRSFTLNRVDSVSWLNESKIRIFQRFYSLELRIQFSWAVWL